MRDVGAAAGLIALLAGTVLVGTAGSAQGEDSKGSDAKNSQNSAAVSGSSAHDECPNLQGNQPEGTVCEQPADQVDEISKTKMTCESGVDTRTGTVTTTFSFNYEKNKWVGAKQAPEWGKWMDIRPLTQQERIDLGCEEAPAQDACPNLDGNQPAGTECQQPPDQVAEISKTKMTCESGVDTRTGTVTTTFSFDHDKNRWVGTKQAPEWGKWIDIRPLTQQERDDLDCDEPTPGPTEVTAVAPEVEEADECETNGTFTIPETEGVQYLLDGEPIAAGTHSGPVDATITAEAVGDAVLTNEDFMVEVELTEALPCEVAPTEGVAPTPDQRPTPVAVPTAVDAGSGSAGTGSTTSLLGVVLMGSGLLLLVLTGTVAVRRIGRGAHEF